MDVRTFEPFVGLVDFVDADHFSVHFQTVEPLFHVYLQLLFHRASFVKQNRGEHSVARSFRMFQHTVHDIFCGMLFYLLPADGAECTSYTRIEQTQILINFSRSTYGRAWITATYFLFNGNCRRDTFDKVALRLTHTSQKLACVAAETFHITALPFGIKSIECK